MELPGLSRPPGGASLRAFGPSRSPRVLRRLLVLLLSLAALAAVPSSALAWSPPGQPYPASAPPGTASLVSSMGTPPVGYHLIPNRVLAIARQNVAVRAQLKRMPNLVAYVYTRGNSVWQVSWFTPTTITSHPQWEEIQAYVDDNTQQVTQVWTGYQVAWTMARGYPNAFGKSVNRPWIWLPLCALFVLPFIPWRRRPSLLHLDLLVLLGFSISLAFFNHANLGMSVPSIYPFMIYLMARLVGLAFGRGRPKGPLRIVVPTPVLAILLVFLVGFRVGLNITDSNVIDVGYAGTIGGWKITHGQKLYGNPNTNVCGAVATATNDCWPSSNGAGDTYGPFNYFAYVPGVAALGWSGTWDNNLPASHAAAIAFDLLTMIGLFFLGRRIRGPSFGIILAYLWAAYPFTLYALSSNSNDSLVALMTVVALLVITSAPARGVAGACAGLTKFAPLVLGPLLLRGTGEFPHWSERAFWTRSASYIGAYALALLVLMLPVVLKHDLTWFYDDTIKYQASRPAPFSIWGLWGNTFGGVKSALNDELRIWEGLTVIAALLFAYFPRGKRELWQVAALGGALIIAVECCLSYWFYLYIPWFFPMAIVALILVYPTVVPLVGEEPAGWAEDAQVRSAVAAGTDATRRPRIDTPPADLTFRVFGFLVDWGFGVGLGVLLTFILGAVGSYLDLVLFFAYLTVTVGLSGQTLAMRLFHLRVVSVWTGEPLGYEQAALRALVSYLSASCLLLGYVAGAVRSDGMTWHDAAVGSRVISEWPEDQAPAPKSKGRTAV